MWGVWHRKKWNSESLCKNSLKFYKLYKFFLSPKAKFTYALNILAFFASNLPRPLQIHFWGSQLGEPPGRGRCRLACWLLGLLCMLFYQDFLRSPFDFMSYERHLPIKVISVSRHTLLLFMFIFYQRFVRLPFDFVSYERHLAMKMISVWRRAFHAFYVYLSTSISFV